MKILNTLFYGILHMFLFFESISLVIFGFVFVLFSLMTPSVFFEKLLIGWINSFESRKNKITSKINMPLWYCIVGVVLIIRAFEIGISLDKIQEYEVVPKVADAFFSFLIGMTLLTVHKKAYEPAGQSF